MQYFEKIHETEKSGFSIVVSVAPEDLHPRDMFDDSIDNIADICDRIDRGLLHWFIVRVEAYKAGVLLGADYLNGNLYDNARQFITESGGYFDDMVHEAINQARTKLEQLRAE